MSSFRRTFLRSTPASTAEEMRPMIQHTGTTSGIGNSGNTTTTSTTTSSTSITTSSGSNKKGDSSRLSSKTRSNDQPPPSHIHPSLMIASTTVSKGNFEFSVRDHSDATAKRGFRVQVPKRILCYTILVFFILPIFLFLYVEMIKQSHKHQQQVVDASQHDHDTNNNDLHDTTLLPPLSEEELLPPPDQDGGSVAELSSVTTNTSLPDESFADIVITEAAVTPVNDQTIISQETLVISPEQEEQNSSTAAHSDIYPAEVSIEVESLFNATEVSSINATESMEVETELEPSGTRYLRAVIVHIYEKWRRGW